MYLTKMIPDIQVLNVKNAWRVVVFLREQTVSAHFADLKKSTGSDLNFLGR